MNRNAFQWAVVGAGPAGIAAVGKLMDNGVKPQDILWLDPAFDAGHFARRWSRVPSNTSVRKFTDYLSNCKAFAYERCPQPLRLDHLSPDKTCMLADVVKPLVWITGELMKQVHTRRLTVEDIHLARRSWTLCGGSEAFLAHQVILANGAEPRALDINHPHVLNLETALNPELLAKAVRPEDTVGVFGSSHSAVLVLKNLADLGVRRIINFYRSPSRYALDMGEWILFDNTGLKGEAATWAREHIDGTLPKNLERYLSTPENLERFLPACDTLIGATGFSAQHTPRMRGHEKMTHNPKTGIIAPGLFGFGIAYPELRTDPFGNEESQVGLWKFMDYLNRVMPVWLKYTP